MKGARGPATLLLVLLSMAMGVSLVYASDMAAVREEAERGRYRLIAADELWERVSRDPDGVMLVDTRQDWEYTAGHIAGAVNFSMEPTWLARLTRRAELEQLLGPDLKGVPTVVFLDPSGSERRDLRLVEFLALAGFLQYMGTFQ